MLETEAGGDLNLGLPDSQLLFSAVHLLAPLLCPELTRGPQDPAERSGRRRRNPDPGSASSVEGSGKCAKSLQPVGRSFISFPIEELDLLHSSLKVFMRIKCDNSWESASQT